MITFQLQSSLNNLRAQHLFRQLKQLEGSQGRSIVVDGKEVLNFCSNNYLGLAEDPRLVEAAIECMRNEGWGAGASRLVCGNLRAHERLEAKLAAFKGAQKALIFNSGYAANVGIISSLFDREDVIFSDKLNHASIVDGILLSRANFKRYAHLDMNVLEDMLKNTCDFRRRVIVTDSVFSMDGDIAPLPKIVQLAQKYNCLVMVDEAHGVGVLGKNGRGAAEHFGLENEIDIQMGTLSKAVGSFGAYVVGDNELIDFLINHARSFIYTTGLPPAVAAASFKAIEIIETEPQRRQALWEHTRFLKMGLEKRGFDTLNCQTPIIPVMLKDKERALAFSKRLFEEGVFVAAIRPPTVPEKTARLRVTVTAAHRREDLEFLLEKMEWIGKELEVI